MPVRSFSEGGFELFQEYVVSTGNYEQLTNFYFAAMNSPTEEIKTRLDIVDFIQSYVRLQKSGINFKANCPFHAEKTPSFFVSPSRQLWHCFGGCGEGGDIFKFVMKIEGLDFPEALKVLAARAGVELKREDPALRSEKNRMHDLCEEAAKIFEKNLSLTPVAQDYVKSRGIAPDTAKKFRIGFAPQSWDFLLKALIAKGFRRDEVEKAGLAVRSQDASSWYDRFRSRIIFPISDVNGRVIGFGGRIFQPEAGSRKPEAAEAKYINTPQTLIYDKSKALYGFDKAKDAIRQKNEAVIVEGYMDCVMSHQAGVANTIAVSGTALTPFQVKALRRLCDSLLFSFDADAAGDSATRRSLSIAAQFECARKIVAIPSGKDPADTVREDPARWLRAVETACPVVEFYFTKALREYNPASVEGKKAISAMVLAYIAELADEIEKGHWVAELAKKLGIEEESVWRELRKKSSGAAAKNISSAPQNASGAHKVSRRELLEERMLSLLAAVGEERGHTIYGRNFEFSTAANEELFGAFRAQTAVDSWPANLRERLEVLRFRGEVLGAATKDMGEELLICAREFEKECVREKLQSIAAEIEKKEKGKGDIEPLLKDFHELSGKLKIIV